MNQNFMKSSFKAVAAALVASLAFTSCSKDQFTEKDALNLELSRLRAQRSIDSIKTAQDRTDRNALLRYQRTLDSLDRENAGGRVFYTVNVISATSSAVAGVGAGGRIEEAEGVTGAVVTTSQYGRVVSATTQSGIATFELRSGEATVAVTAPAHTSADYTVNLTAPFSGGAIGNTGIGGAQTAAPVTAAKNGTTVYVGNVLPLFEISTDGAEMATIRGRAFIETDLTNDVEELANTQNAAIQAAGTVANIFVSAGINSNNATFYNRYLGKNQNLYSTTGSNLGGTGGNTSGTGITSGANAGGIGVITKLFYGPATPATGSGTAGAPVNRVAINATGDYTILVPAAVSGLPIVIKSDEIVANRTYFRSDALGNGTITTQRFMYGPQVTPDRVDIGNSVPRVTFQAFTTPATVTASYTAQVSATAFATGNNTFAAQGMYGVAPSVVATLGTAGGTAPVATALSAEYTAGSIAGNTGINITNGGTGLVATAGAANDAVFSFTRNDLITIGSGNKVLTVGGAIGEYIQVTDGGFGFNYTSAGTFDRTLANGLNLGMATATATGAGAFTGYLPAVNFTVLPGETAPTGRAIPDLTTGTIAAVDRVTPGANLSTIPSVLPTVLSNASTGFVFGPNTANVLPDVGTTTGAASTSYSIALTNIPAGGANFTINTTQFDVGGTAGLPTVAAFPASTALTPTFGFAPGTYTVTFPAGGPAGGSTATILVPSRAAAPTTGAGTLGAGNIGAVVPTTNYSVVVTSPNAGAGTLSINTTQFDYLGAVGAATITTQTGVGAAAATLTFAANAYTVNFPAGTLANATVTVSMPARASAPTIAAGATNGITAPAPTAGTTVANPIISANLLVSSAVAGVPQFNTATNSVGLAGMTPAETSAYQLTGVVFSTVAGKGDITINATSLTANTLVGAQALTGTGTNYVFVPNVGLVGRTTTGATLRGGPATTNIVVSTSNGGTIPAGFAANALTGPVTIPGGLVKSIGVSFGTGYDNTTFPGLINTVGAMPVGITSIGVQFTTLTAPTGSARTTNSLSANVFSSGTGLDNYVVTVQPFGGTLGTGQTALAPAVTSLIGTSTAALNAINKVDNFVNSPVSDALASNYLAAAAWLAVFDAPTGAPRVPAWGVPVFSGTTVTGVKMIRGGAGYPNNTANVRMRIVPNPFRGTVSGTTLALLTGTAATFTAGAGIVLPTAISGAAGTPAWFDASYNVGAGLDLAAALTNAGNIGLELPVTPSFLTFTVTNGGSGYSVAPEVYIADGGLTFGDISGLLGNSNTTSVGPVTMTGTATVAAGGSIARVGNTFTGAAANQGRVTFRALADPAGVDNNLVFKANPAVFVIDRLSNALTTAYNAAPNTTGNPYITIGAGGSVIGLGSQQTAANNTTLDLSRLTESFVTSAAWPAVGFHSTPTVTIAAPATGTAATAVIDPAGVETATSIPGIRVASTTAPANLGTSVRRTYAVTGGAATAPFVVFSADANAVITTTAGTPTRVTTAAGVTWTLPVAANANVTVTVTTANNVVAATTAPTITRGNGDNTVVAQPSIATYDLRFNANGAVTAGDLTYEFADPTTVPATAVPTVSVIGTSAGLVAPTVKSITKIGTVTRVVLTFAASATAANTDFTIVRVSYSVPFAAVTTIGAVGAPTAVAPLATTLGFTAGTPVGSAGTPSASVVAATPAQVLLSSETAVATQNVNGQITGSLGGKIQAIRITSGGSGYGRGNLFQRFFTNSVNGTGSSVGGAGGGSVITTINAAGTIATVNTFSGGTVTLVGGVPTSSGTLTQTTTRAATAAEPAGTTTFFNFTGGAGSGVDGQAYTIIGSNLSGTGAPAGAGNTAGTSSPQLGVTGSQFDVMTGVTYVRDIHYGTGLRID